MTLLLGAAPAPVVIGRITLADALRMAESAVAVSVRRGQAVAVVIVNGEGRIVLAHRMDRAPFISIDLAAAKARTAAGIGAPTRVLENDVRAGNTTVLAVEGIVPITGGVAVLSSGQVIGAVGVSGSSTDTDEIIADAALIPISQP